MWMTAMLAGAGIGFILGLTGMGGGALALPFLLWVLGLPPVTAVGTDLVFTTVTRLVGSIQHRRQKTVWLRPIFYLSLGSLPGAWLSSWWVLRMADPRWVEVIFPRLLGLTLSLVGLYILARSMGWFRVRAEGKERWPSARAAWLIGFVGGLVVGATSVGGGVLISAAFLLWYHVPPAHLVGLDVLHGALLSGTAAIPYTLHDQVAWHVLPALWLGALPGVWLGARLVVRWPTQRLRALLGLIIVAAGVRLLWAAG